jgi:hypothetical protein
MSACPFATNSSAFHRLDHCTVDGIKTPLAFSRVLWQFRHTRNP